MKIGKLPEPVLIRSVLKQVGHRRNEVLVGPAVGQDCAVMELEEGEVFVLSCDPITGTTKDIGGHSVHITANDLAASGAEPVGIMLTMLLTPDTEEAQLKEIMQDVEKTCKELNMEVLGGHTEVTDVVKQTLISLTGVGKMKKENVLTTASVKPGDDIVVTKWIGLLLRQRKKKACFWSILRRLLWRLQKNSTNIFPLFRRQKLPQSGAYLLCTILPRAVYLALCGKWEAVPVWVLTLI